MTLTSRSFLDIYAHNFARVAIAVPNGPKVGSGGSLSPRGVWRASSDRQAEPWLDGLEAARDWVRQSL